MKEIKLNVPYHSQILEIKSEEWKSRGCSIACLAMSINYFKNQKENNLKNFYLDVNDILNDAIKFNFYDEKIGYWIHHKISLLPHNYGVPCYAEEFRSRKLGIKTEFEDEMKEKGIKKIIKSILENRLVIFSMPKDWIHQDKYHSSLLVGIKFSENNLEEVLGFYYHDPNFENEYSGAFKYIEIEKFRQYWRGLAIFVG